MTRSTNHAKAVDTDIESCGEHALPDQLFDEVEADYQEMMDRKRNEADDRERILLGRWLDDSRMTPKEHQNQILDLVPLVTADELDDLAKHQEAQRIIDDGEHPYQYLVDRFGESIEVMVARYGEPIESNNTPSYDDDALAAEGELSL